MPSRTTSRRLLATLSAAPATTSTAAPAALLPPYTHALPDTAVQPGHAPSSAMRPPYTFVLQPSTITGPSATLKSKVSFKLLEPCERAAQQAVRWRAWAEGLVSTDAGRAHVQKAWTASIIALERAKSSGNRTPEVAFQALGDQLRADTALEAIRQTGSLVVRDVVPDGQAMAWAREILELLEAREGHPVYWSDAQLAARSNPSVLSANKQVSAALLGEQGEPYIDASAVRVGVAEVSPPPRILDLSTGASSSWSTSPTLAHLALTATRATLPATDHAAIYALLRPLFRPLRSRLSFYHPSGYLDPANWAMLAAAELAVPAPVSPIAVPAAGSASLESRGGAKWLPHLEGTWTSTDLAPGDMLYRQAAIPAQNPLLSGEEGLTLPVSPLPSASSEDLVHAQRAAFEAGLPPPQAQREGSVAIEDGRSAHDIATGGGRRAMGF